MDIFDAYYAVPIQDMEIRQLLMSIATLTRDHRLRMPPDLVIMIKALVTAGGSARMAYPQLDVITKVREKVLGFLRNEILFIFNFHPRHSYEQYRMPATPGTYRTRGDLK